MLHDRRRLLLTALAGVAAAVAVPRAPAQAQGYWRDEERHRLEHEEEERHRQRDAWRYGERGKVGGGRGDWQAEREQEMWAARRREAMRREWEREHGQYRPY